MQLNNDSTYFNVDAEYELHKKFFIEYVKERYPTATPTKKQDVWETDEVTIEHMDIGSENFSDFMITCTKLASAGCIPKLIDVDKLILYTDCTTISYVAVQENLHGTICTSEDIDEIGTWFEKNKKKYGYEFAPIASENFMWVENKNGIKRSRRLVCINPFQLLFLVEKDA